MLQYPSALALHMPRFVDAAEKAPLPLVIAELVLAVLCIVLLLVFRKRILKVLFACASEVCLFLACKHFFGDGALLTEVMRWITAAAACILTLAIVNRINWNNLRGRDRS